MLCVTVLTGPVLDLTLAAETLKLLPVCASEPCMCILWSLILNASRGKEPVELEGSAEAVGHLPAQLESRRSNSLEQLGSTVDC